MEQLQLLSRYHLELCCAQVIVTMKARLHKGDNVDGRHLYENLHDGYPVQGVQAKDLHCLAGVPEGPCGFQELEMFQKALSPQYQIVVLTVDKPHMNTYKGQEKSTHSSRSALSWLYFVWRIFKQILFLF